MGIAGDVVVDVAEVTVSAACVSASGDAGMGGWTDIGFKFRNEIGRESP
ncbi:hypothetical protein RRSWK_01720 [Rhodopirellula sp. SWK7]|nr:hypothetical protein RRSWK_01720 [Rhodopirellula sp. SWK7]